MAKEKKAFVPKSYHKLVKKAAFEATEGVRYMIVGSDIYSVDMNSDEYKKNADARMAKRRAKITARIEKNAKKVAERATKKAEKKAARENKKAIRRAKILAKAEAKAAAV